MWKCAACGADQRPPSRRCRSCNEPTRLPSNVALAGEDEEHLLARLSQSRTHFEASDPQSWDRMSGARETVELNKCVSINIHPETLVSILQDDRLRYVNLHDNLRARAILAYPPELVAKRKGIDNLAFGNDGEDLTFGALNIGTLGLYSYGACCVFLKSDELANQISFLERNSFSYCTLDGPGVTFHIPLGVRALWHSVSDLAVLKHKEIIAGVPDISRETLGNLIIESEGDKGTDDFIEAQIYPPITLRCFKKILYDPGITRPNRAKGLVGKAAGLSRRLLGDYLKSLEGDIAVEIVRSDRRERPKGDESS